MRPSDSNEGSGLTPCGNHGSDGSDPSSPILAKDTLHTVAANLGLLQLFEDIRTMKLHLAQFAAAEALKPSRRPKSGSGELPENPEEQAARPFQGI